MEELTTKQWIQLIESIHTRYAPIFVLTGGEPLVHPDFEQIVSTLNRVGAPWGMVTNGMVLSSDRLDFCVENGIKAITLSVDGTESTHRFIRRHPESWNCVLSALDLLGKSSILFIDVVTCVFPQNLASLDQTAELLISKGISRWRLFRIFPKGNAANNPELLLSYEQSHELLSWIASHRQLYKQRGLSLSFSCEGYVPFEIDRTIRDEPYFCRAGISIGSILADGTVTGCNNNGVEFSQGNILTADFEEIWKNRFEKYRKPSWKRTGICSDCGEWNSCQGGSMHLRQSDSENPLFCYCHDVDLPQ